MQEEEEEEEAVLDGSLTMVKGENMKTYSVGKAKKAILKVRVWKV